jgi:Ankyrin repeats (3 copies)/Ankyrin repeat
MERRLTSAILFLWILVLGNGVPFTDTLAYSGPATVKVELLPVYTDTSVTSGILKFLKKGDGVDIEAETISAEGHWCSVNESGRKMMIGFVNCEALDYFSSARKPSARLIPSIPPKDTGSVPRPGYLLQALWNEDVGRIKDLLEKGADPNAQTSCGTRPLLIAAKKGNTEIIRILIENGAQVDGRDKSGLTPLMSAASVGKAGNVETLIAAAADLNAKDNKGITALMWATVKGFADVVEILLSNGADVKAKTAEGLTAKRMSQRIIADLKRSSGDAEDIDEKGDIPSNRLARHERVFRILERAGGE